jgi:peptidoglycan/LPS O-acetylase OafA/YrhL
MYPPVPLMITPGAPSARRSWVAATAIGLTIGLGIGATGVGFRTSLAALVVQGAVCGLAVGTAQALALRHRLGRIAFAWPAALAAIWALGWAITYAAGIEVNDQFTVFGSSGAVAVTALTVILPVLLNAKEREQS